MIPPAHPATLSAMGSTAGRFRRGFRQLRNSPATWLLVRILFIVQLVPVVWDLVRPPAHSYPDKLSIAQIFLGLRKDHFLSGDYWQPFSYAFIHGNFLHLVLNAAAIILLGAKLEHIVTKRSYWLMCLYAVLAGGFLFLLFTPSPSATSSPQTLVGSSAICFAFLVFLTTVSPESKFLPLFLSGKTLGIAIVVANLSLALLNPDLPTGSLARLGRYLSETYFPKMFQIGHACHLGGSLVGLLYGKWLLRPRVTLESLRKAREKSERKG